MSFYVDKLGFTVVTDYIMRNAEAGERAGNRWVMLVPSGGLSIRLTTWFKDLRSGVMKMSLSTSDVQKTYQELNLKGVQPKMKSRMHLRVNCSALTILTEIIG